jgi:hypothetical protein
MFDDYNNYKDNSAPMSLLNKKRKKPENIYEQDD